MSTALLRNNCPHPAFRDPIVWNLEGVVFHQATCTACRSTVTVHRSFSVGAWWREVFADLGDAIQGGQP